MFYEYYCIQHGEFEAQHSIKSPPLSICPKCEEEHIENPIPPKRLISKTSFTLKGGGWASSGYK